MESIADNDKRFQYVKEMNDAEFALNKLLLHEYRALLDDEMTAKQTLLLDIVHKEGPITVREIAERMHVTSSAISQIVGKLEKKTYVKRDINERNRREILVRLGPQGDAYFEKQDEIEKAIVERFYAKLELSEIKHMRDLMFKLKTVVEAELVQSQS
ncbi:MarR family winged helix-turn-helix transcriptional regulator [Paenibacillus hodogayensis]|uniref:MarR family winged helix-turn-helix transcriptional regulator n=1 Tax=Paenibacillus hodogayensis TaxID=279208 RepID=A0ABV5VPF4_9BACL